MMLNTNYSITIIFGGNVSNERIQWIDLSRCVAILCVIACHCIRTFYDYNVGFMQALSFPSQIFACSVLTIGRFGVPLFLMITGFLLLDRNYDNQKTVRFWKFKVKHLWICAIFWAIVGELFLILILHKNIPLEDIFFGILFLKPLSLSYFWYMPMIIGMYILIPFVANALKEYDLDVIIKPTVFFAILVYLLPFIISILKFNGIKGLSVELSLGFSGGTYGLYLIMGYLIKKGYFKKIKTHLLSLIVIISSIGFVLLEIYYFHAGFKLHIFYESPFIFVCAVCLFELFSRLKNIKFYNLIYKISIYSFGIFMIHDLYQMLFKPVFLNLSINNPLKFILLYVIVFALSMITVFIISKIPKFGKYVLLMK